MIDQPNTRSHKPVQNFHGALKQFENLGVSHEGALKSAFRSLSASIGERARVRCRSELSDFSQKQQFLNTVYEEFFQGFSVKVTDTHGIAYAPPSTFGWQRVLALYLRRTRNLLLPHLISGEIGI